MKGNRRLFPYIEHRQHKFELWQSPEGQKYVLHYVKDSGEPYQLDPDHWCHDPEKDVFIKSYTSDDKDYREEVGKYHHYTPAFSNKDGTIIFPLCK